MSIHVVAMVLRAQLRRSTDVKLTTQSKMVLVGLADHANEDGTNAWPSVRTLAAYAECSPRSVQRHLDALQLAGIIAIETAADRARHRPNVYRIALRRLAELSTQGDTMSPGAAPNPSLGQPGGSTRRSVTRKAAERDVPGDKRGGVRVTSVTSPGDIAVSPEPSKPTVSSRTFRQQVDNFGDNESFWRGEAIELLTPIAGEHAGYVAAQLWWMRVPPNVAGVSAELQDPDFVAMIVDDARRKVDDSELLLGDLIERAFRRARVSARYGDDHVADPLWELKNDASA